MLKFVVCLLFFLLLSVSSLGFCLTLHADNVEPKSLEKLQKLLVFNRKHFEHHDKGAYDIATLKIESCALSESGDLNCKSKIFIPVSFFHNPSPDKLQNRAQRLVSKHGENYPPPIPFLFLSEFGDELVYSGIAAGAEFVIVGKRGNIVISKNLTELRYEPKKGKPIYIDNFNNYGYIHIIGMSYKRRMPMLSKFDVTNSEMEAVLSFFQK